MDASIWTGSLGLGAPAAVPARGPRSVQSHTHHAKLSQVRLSTVRILTELSRRKENRISIAVRLVLHLKTKDCRKILWKVEIEREEWLCRQKHSRGDFVIAVQSLEV